MYTHTQLTWGMDEETPVIIVDMVRTVVIPAAEKKGLFGVSS